VEKLPCGCQVLSVGRPRSPPEAGASSSVPFDPSGAFPLAVEGCVDGAGGRAVRSPPSSKGSCSSRAARASSAIRYARGPS